MKREINNTEAIFPMPVLMIATFNDDESVDVMNAAWGAMLSRDHIMLKLTKTHRTVENILKRKAFTVSIADSKHVVEADYFGVVSANDTVDKFERSGLSYVKSDNIDAPIINEFPVVFECEFIEYQDDKYGCGVVAKVINAFAEENVFDGDDIDIGRVDAISFDPYTHGYYRVCERVGDAFKDGLKLK
ncbi:MAG: flavin reductase family protein [Methanosphaera sp.]|nr:flavin reductase family protein [Methanosphaera sp.]